MAPKATTLDKSQVVYNDLVVMNFTRDPKKGFPIKSFHCHAGKQDMGETVELAKSFMQDVKLKAMNNGDFIPDLRLGRVCCIRGTQDSAIDYKFLEHKAGSAPTHPPEEGVSVLAGALEDFSKQ